MKRRIKVIIPVSTHIWNEYVRIEMDKCSDRDTHIDIVNLERGPESIECFYDRAYSERVTIESAESAEKERYNGVIIYCFSEPGLLGAKEKLSIPVVGLCESSLHIASMLGRRFSIIHPSPSNLALSHIDNKLDEYGLRSHCASIRFLGIPVLDLLDRERLEKRILEESMKAIREDNADTLVLGCGSILGVDNIIAKKFHIPVVVPAKASLKVCEALVDMGIAQSKLYYGYPPKKLRT